VPYLLCVASGEAVYIAVLDRTPPASGSSLTGAVAFRAADSAVSPASLIPSITAIAGGASVIGVGSLGRRWPHDYKAGVRLGRQAGSNLFRIQARR
jgi:hypothetical protein